MIHRHLDYPPDAPLTARGDAALDDLLDRGDLHDWQPLLRAIAADPFSDLADRVLGLCDANPRYGTSPLWRAWIARRRALALAGHAPAVSLAELRRRRGLSQQALAERIGMSQSDLSKAERRTDWKVSTLAAIVEGMGLRVRVVALDEDGHVAGTITPENAT
ncbi:MAG: helix-turn-helix transcriptional regulator [Ardenticatenales bacterium]